MVSRFRPWAFMPVLRPAAGSGDPLRRRSAQPPAPMTDHGTGSPDEKRPSAGRAAESNAGARDATGREGGRAWRPSPPPNKHHTAGSVRGGPSPCLDSSALTACMKTSATCRDVRMPAAPLSGPSPGFGFCRLRPAVMHARSARALCTRSVRRWRSPWRMMDRALAAASSCRPPSKPDCLLQEMLENASTDPAEEKMASRLASSSRYGDMRRAADLP